MFTFFLVLFLQFRQGPRRPDRDPQARYGPHLLNGTSTGGEVSESI